MQTSFRFPSSALKLALVSACLLGAGASHAAVTTASATSTVVAPMAISKTTDLAFGSFAATTGGTVTVSTSGARTGSGVSLLTSSPTAALFAVTGEGTMTYSISFTGTSATLTSGADSMAFATVSDATGANATSGNVSSGTLAAGAGAIYVGGVLTVAAAQPAGTYTGSISATVEYN